MEQSVELLLNNLLSCRSISPEEAGCMEILTHYLTPVGIDCRRIDVKDTANLFASHGNGAPHICFVGHIDVVPAGDEQDWDSPPFEANVRDGKIYARGVADMKGGVAAMTTAFRTLIEAYSSHQGTLSLLITSDEEGSAENGIQAVLPYLQAEGICIDYAIVGEPTAKDKLGDFARNGRRGSLNLNLTITGKQGHVAYPENIVNPIHGLGEIITQLASIQWDNGNQNFPPTSCQFSNITAGTGAENVVPQRASALVNWRYNTEQTDVGIRYRVEKLVNKICALQHLQANYHWRLSGEPFSTNNPILLKAVADAVYQHCGEKIIFNTAGGTSDARFMAKYGADTVEFGTINASIHQVNENMLVADLLPMVAVYRDSVLNLWQV